MPVTIKGGVETRKALKKFQPNLAKETTKQYGSLLRPITNRARGFVPAEPPLSGWGNAVGTWANRNFVTSEVRRGITYSTTPSKPNRKGFRSLARLLNKSAAGSIYETAGRKSGADGRPQAPMVKHYTDSGTALARFEGKMIRSGDKSQSMSNNPKAGEQFIGSMGRLVNAKKNMPATRGRPSRKMTGRLIFKAWAQDGGKTTAAVTKAIELSIMKFNRDKGKGK